MADELWNQKLTRENIRDFYMSTVVMVYSSCYGITKEATRCENAIVKSYLDVSFMSSEIFFLRTPRISLHSIRFLRI